MPTLFPVICSGARRDDLVACLDICFFSAAAGPPAAAFFLVATDLVAALVVADFDGVDILVDAPVFTIKLPFSPLGY